MTHGKPAPTQPARGCLLPGVIGGALALLLAALLVAAVVFSDARSRPAALPQAGAPGPAATPAPTLTPVDTPPPPLAETASPPPRDRIISTPTPWAEYPERLLLAPQAPAPADPILATIRGVSATACVPAYAGQQRLETGYLPIDLQQASGADCPAAETAWELSIDLGPQVAGSHIVEVYVTLDGSRTRHAAQLLFVNPEPLPPPVTIPPGATFTPPPTPTPFAENPEGLRTNPPDPVAGALFEVVVSGEWPSGCVPTLRDVTVLETGYVMVSLATPSDPNLACTAAVTSWSVSVAVPPLAPGSYLLVAEINHQGAITRHAARSLYLAAP